MSRGGERVGGGKTLLHWGMMQGKKKVEGGDWGRVAKVLPREEQNRTEEFGVPL